MPFGHQMKHPRDFAGISRKALSGGKLLQGTGCAALGIVFFDAIRVEQSLLKRNRCPQSHRFAARHIVETIRRFALPLNIQQDLLHRPGRRDESTHAPGRYHSDYKYPQCRCPQHTAPASDRLLGW